MKRTLQCLVFALTAILVIICWAGTQNATVIGSIFYAGNPLAGATVRLINAGTAFSQKQTSSSDGTFTFTDVPPAENYVISVEKAGFSPMVLTGITVQVGEEKLVLPPFLLQMVAPPPTQTPAVTPPPTPTPAAPTPTPAPAPAAKTAPPPAPTRQAPSVSLDLLSTTESGVIDSQMVHTLPLVNRDFIDLALLVPGTFPVEQGSSLQGASLVVNGARADMNNFLLDGADNNDYTVNQSLPFQIVEAMQEFRVQTSTSNAEYGRSGGAQINIVSRSGSNKLHGELFEFNRNSALAAGNYFSEYSGGGFSQYASDFSDLPVLGGGSPLVSPTLSSLYNHNTPPVNQNQFGGNIGGPVLKDKVFGFFNWESFRLANPRPLFEQVPGNTFRSASACDAYLVPFNFPPCNSTALALDSLYAAPNVPLVASSGIVPFTNPTPTFYPGIFFDDLGAFNVGQASNHTYSDNFLERVDWRVNSRVNMSFKHNILQINQVQAGNVPASATYPGSGTQVGGRNQNVSYNYVHQLSPRVTNEFRFGWNRFRLTTTALDASINPATLGLQNLNFTNEGLPTVVVGGAFTSPYSSFATLGASSATPSNRADSVFSAADNITFVRGRHSWKFGGEFRDIRLNIDNEGPGRGLIALNDGTFGVGDLPNIASIARVCAPFLPDFSTVFAQSCGQFGNGFERNFSTRSAAGYAQDQWRPLKNLTLNYGVRYEVNTAPVEVHNRLVNYYPSLATNASSPSGGLPGGLVQAGTTTIFDPEGDVIGTDPSPAPRAGFNTDTANWGPRFGFAWDPLKNNRTVIRGGYALVFDQPSLQPEVNQLLNPPFVEQSFSFFTAFSLSDTFSACAPGFSDIYAGCLSYPANATSGWLSIPYSVTAIDQHNKTPYVSQYHLGLEQQLGNKALMELTYVGSEGHRLPLLEDISPCTTIAFLTNNAIPPCATASGYILDQANVGNSNFNSLQARIETRNFHGLQLRAFYQWTKSIDNASSVQPQVFLLSPVFSSFVVSGTAIPPGLFMEPTNLDGANNISPTLSLEGNLPLLTTRPSLPQNSSNLAGERAPSDFDVRHTFVAAYSYDIPRFAPRIGTGWQITGITTLRSGQPFSVYADYFGTPLRPNAPAPLHVDTSNPQNALAPISSFGFNYNLEPGSLGRNALTGPHYINFDFALVKNTKITERANLQLRAEFFNLFNNANFRQPYSQLGFFFVDTAGTFSSIFPSNCAPSIVTPSGTTPVCSFVDPFFGQILQAFPARQVQLAAKLVF